MVLLAHRLLERAQFILVVIPLVGEVAQLLPHGGHEVPHLLPASVLGRGHGEQRRKGECNGP